MRQFKVDHERLPCLSWYSHLQLLMIFGTIPHCLEEDELLKFEVHSLV